jgi:hypothetical protein
VLNKEEFIILNWEIRTKDYLMIVKDQSLINKIYNCKYTQGGTKQKESRMLKEVILEVVAWVIFSASIGTLVLVGFSL